MLALLFCIVTLLARPTSALPFQTPEQKLDRAIASLRHVDPAKLTETQKASHRLERPGGVKVEVGEILSAATPADIDLLLDVRGALYHRLSDECLYEVERVNAALRRLGRSRYRKATGITEKAETK
jgi:hypothetical protein